MAIVALTASDRIADPLGAQQRGSQGCSPTAAPITVGRVCGTEVPIRDCTAHRRLNPAVCGNQSANAELYRQAWHWALTNRDEDGTLPGGEAMARAHYVRGLADTPIKVNSADPSHVATDFNCFRGARTLEQGAAVAVRLATVHSRSYRHRL